VWRRWLIATVLSVPLSIVGLFWILGLVWNQTPSLPVGLWRKVNTDTSSFRRGAFVTFCPPEKAIQILKSDRKILGWGSCPNGYRTFLKQVEGVPGDSISIDKEFVSINGHKISNSRRYHRNKSMYTSPTTFRVPEGFLWLMATSSKWSFDSRYFGLVPINYVQNEVEPLVVEFPKVISIDEF